LAVRTKMSLSELKPRKMEMKRGGEASQESHRPSK